MSTQLPLDIRHELTALLDKADANLRVSTRRDDPDFIQRRIKERVDHDMTIDDAVLLGVAWGEAARRALGWEWLWLEEAEEPAIVSPGREYLVMPLQLLAMNRDSDADHRNTLLLFNILRAGELPPSEQGALLRLE